MNKADLQRLFQVFYQAQSPSVGGHGGTGFGLTISKRLATLMGGDLTVKSFTRVSDSCPGMTAFTLVVPVKASSDIAVNIHSSPESSLKASFRVNDVLEQNLSARLHTARAQNIQAGSPYIPDSDESPFTGLAVAVADDNIINRKIFNFNCRKLGVSAIECVANGQMLVDLVASNIKGDKEFNLEFDYLFVDLHMPRLNGLETAKQIRAIYKKHPEKSRPKLVLMTAAEEGTNTPDFNEDELKRQFDKRLLNVVTPDALRNIFQEDMVSANQTARRF